MSPERRQEVARVRQVWSPADLAAEQALAEGCIDARRGRPRTGARAAGRDRRRPLAGVRAVEIWTALNGMTVAEVLRQVLAGIEEEGLAARARSRPSLDRPRLHRLDGGAPLRLGRLGGPAGEGNGPHPSRRPAAAREPRALLDRPARDPGALPRPRPERGPLREGAAPEPLLLPESSEPLGPRYHARVVQLVAIERRLSSDDGAGRAGGDVAELTLPPLRRRAETPSARRAASACPRSRSTAVVSPATSAADDVARRARRRFALQADFAEQRRKPAARREPPPGRRADRLLGRRAAAVLRDAAARPLVRGRARRARRDARRARRRALRGDGPRGSSRVHPARAHRVALRRAFSEEVQPMTREERTARRQLAALASHERGRSLLQLALRGIQECGHGLTIGCWVKPDRRRLGLRLPARLLAGGRGGHLRALVGRQAGDQGFRARGGLPPGHGGDPRARRPREAPVSAPARALARPLTKRRGETRSSSLLIDALADSAAPGEKTARAGRALALGARRRRRRRQLDDRDRRRLGRAGREPEWLFVARRPTTGAKGSAACAEGVAELLARRGAASRRASPRRAARRAPSGRDRARRARPDRGARARAHGDRAAGERDSLRRPASAPAASSASRSSTVRPRPSPSSPSSATRIDYEDAAAALPTPGTGAGRSLPRSSGRRRRPDRKPLRPLATDRG